MSAQRTWPDRLTDDYRVTNQSIGKGSYGSVVVAEHRKTGCKYALKTVAFTADTFKSVLKVRL